MIHRQNNVLKTTSSKPDFAASYTVIALPVGAVASAASSGSTATVDGGHGFAAGDKVLIFDGTTATFISQVLASVTGTTLVWSSSTPTIAKGNLLCNLGVDTASGSTPAFDASPMVIYSDADGSDVVTNSILTTDTTGNYDYYFRGDGRSWELIRDASGTVAGVVPGWGGQSSRHNVADYGAAIDGSTSDHLRCDSAMLAASTVGGGTVFFPEGDTELTTTVNCRSGVDIRGSGRGSKISTIGTINMFTCTGVSGVKISDLFIEGSSHDTTGTGVFVSSSTSSRIKVSSCHFEKIATCVRTTGGDRIDVINCTAVEIVNAIFDCRNSTNSIVSGCEFNGTRTVGDAVNASRFIFAVSADATTITSKLRAIGNAVSNTVNSPIYIAGSDCVIANNIIDTIPSGAIEVDIDSVDVTNLTGRRCVINSNIIRGCTGTSILLGTGGTDGCAQCIVSSNVITNGGTGITVSNHSQDNLIVGNTIDTMTSHGTNTGGTGVSNCTWSNNSIINTGTVTGSIRGMLFQSGEDHLIIGNFVRKTDTHGIHINGTTSDFSVIGNVIINAGETNSITGQIGISDQSTSTRTFISGNKCWSEDGIHQHSGISIGPNTTNALVVNNDVRNNVTGGVSINGSATTPTVNGNAGHVTENSGTATITSGTTSVVVTHGMAAAPTVDDISVVLAENPTNDPGNIWIDTITATQFTVNCRSDPGASNLDIGWKAGSL